MAAQYSIPFCVALSLYHDPKDPESFTDKRISDEKILAMMRKVRLRVDPEIEEKGWDRAARVTLSTQGWKSSLGVGGSLQGYAAQPDEPIGAGREGEEFDPPHT